MLFRSRFKRTDQEYKTPFNIRIGGREYPIGLAVITLTLLFVALANLFTKKIATISGIGFTVGLFIVFTVSERINARRKHAEKKGMEQFNLEMQSEVAQQVVSEFVAKGPTEAELQAAKDFLIGGFALRLDSNRKLMDNLSNIAWFDLPLDYLDTWTQQVSRLTVNDIQQAFARHLQPDRMVTVVLGASKP